MTFIEEVYTELTKRTPINTDNFSTDWLGQSRSYYTSIKSRRIDASSQSLVHLMNKLHLLQEAMSVGRHDLLRSTAHEHGQLCERIAAELAQRSCAKNVADLPVRRMIWTAMGDLLGRAEMSIMPVLIL
jgi:hypothetical protein